MRIKTDVLNDQKYFKKEIITILTRDTKQKKMRTSEVSYLIYFILVPFIKKFLYR